MTRALDVIALGILPLACAGLLGACQVETEAVGVANDHLGTFRASNIEAVVGPDGACPTGINLDPAALRQPPASVRKGISECDLVRLQGRPATVTIVDLPDGTRRVEMFYRREGGGTRGYTFVANRLISTPPGALKE